MKKKMSPPRLSGMFGRVALRAMQDALYEREIDACWSEFREVFERPEVREAEAVIMRALAEAFCPAPAAPTKKP